MPTPTRTAAAKTREDLPPTVAARIDARNQPRDKPPGRGQRDPLGRLDTDLLPYLVDPWAAYEIIPFNVDCKLVIHGVEFANGHALIEPLPESWRGPTWNYPDNVGQLGHQSDLGSDADHEAVQERVMALEHFVNAHDVQQPKYQFNEQKNVSEPVGTVLYPAFKILPR